MLLTSRERLRVSGERVCPVPPLSVAPAGSAFEVLEVNEAVALFAARAQAASGTFELDAANAPAVAAICARLDGLPLAIELAAARTTTLSPKALLRRLDQRLPLLTGGPRDADQRQETLRNTIAWSYDLLSSGEQDLFERLSVFVDGCRVDAAEAVCDPERELGVDVFNGLAGLVEKNLLRQRPDWDSEPRFWMLETIHEYALEQLRNGADYGLVAQRHADYFLALAEGVMDSHEFDRDSIRLLEGEHDNLRAAFSWFHDSRQPEGELRLICALAEFWDVRGHHREAWTVIKAALEAAQPDVSVLRVRALAAASDFARSAGAVDLARSYCEEGLALSRQLGDDAGVCRALHELGEAALEDEAYDEAADLFEEAIAVARAAGINAAGSIGNLGYVAFLQGDHERAAALSVQALALFRQRRHLSGTLIALSNLAEAELALGRRDEARVRLLECLTLAREAEATGDALRTSLETTAALLLDAGAAEIAARITGATDALLETMAFSLTPAEQRRRERIRGEVHARLGPRAEELREEGRRTPAAADLAAEALSAMPTD